MALILLLAAFILLIGFPTLQSLPTYDDTQYWQDDEYRHWNWRWLKAWGNRGLSRGTIMATFAVVNPPYHIEAFHVENSLCHFICAVEVFGLASHFMPFHQAAFAALVFAASPLAVSAVQPLAFRSSVLSAMFGYAAILLTLAGHGWMGILLLAPAIQSREDGFIFGGVVFLLTPWPIRLAMIAIAGIVSVTRGRKMLWVFHHKQRRNGDEGMVSAGFTSSLPQPSYTITAFTENILRWSLWQFGFRQNPDPQIDAVSWLSDKFVCALMIAAFAIIVMLTGSPSVHVALLLILVSPWVGSWFFVLPDAVSEGRAYSTISGFALLAAPLADHPFLAIPFLIFLALSALHRNYQRRGGVSYWLSAYDASKPKLRVLNNIAAEYQKTGDLDNAKIWHQKAFELAPGNGVVLANAALWHEGQARMARRDFANDLVLWNRADIQKAQDGHKLAVEHMTKAIALMSLGIEACPTDPCVKIYHEKLWEHASLCGLFTEPPIK